MYLGPTDVGPMLLTYNCNSAELSELILTSPYQYSPPPGFLTVLLLNGTNIC